MLRRTGVTLVEVLIAIFVMGIGLMALLTLFPLGALRMAQAIQDTHSATAAANATAIANAQNIRYDANIASTTATNSYSLFANPCQANLRRGGNMPNLATTNPNGPGYPIFVDGVGFQAYAGNSRYWLGGNLGTQHVPAIPRCTITAVSSQGGVAVTSLKQQAVDRWFTYLEDYNFGSDALLPSGAAGARDYKFSWAYLLRKPRLSSGLVDLTVVVYRGRPSTITSSQPLEHVYTAQFNPNAKVVTLTWGAGQIAPTLKAGDWFLDTTATSGVPNAFFYRAVTVSPGNNTMDVEINVPFRSIAAGPGTVVVLDNVIDVYEKGTGWAGQ